MTTPQQTLAVSPLGATRRALADISQWDTFIRFLSPAHTLTADEIILLDTCGFLHITDRHCRCHTPSHPLRLTAGDEPDGFHLRGPVGGRRTSISIRADSYFSHSNLSLPQLLVMVRDMALDDGMNSVAYRAGVTTKTVHHHWIQLTNRMKHWLYSHPFKSVPLFAEDDVVEIDELYKIHTYEKAIGQFSDWDEKEGVWVFGAINRDNTKLFMTTVSSRRTEDLIPLLYVITEPNTTIVSDALSTYYQLSKGFDYHCINKKKDGFSRKENAEGGGYFTVTVNHIENRWRWLREMYREGHHTAAQYTERMLHEHMYRWYNRKYFDLIKRHVISTVKK